MVQHIRRTHSLQRSLGSPPNNKKVGCCNHQPSMCSTWLGHVQLTALPSWKPQHGLTVMWSFYSSQEGGQGLCPPAASCRLPFLVHLHEELLRSEKTSRASPSPPSRKLQTVAYGQLSSPCRLAPSHSCFGQGHIKQQHRQASCDDLSTEDPGCALPWGQDASQPDCTEHEEESQNSTGTAAAMEPVEIQEWKVQGTEEVTCRMRCKCQEYHAEYIV